MNYKYFTSESVAAGHPDKICDQISDAVLDAAIKQDKKTHAGIECLVTTNKIIISGEIKTKAKLSYEKIARRLVKDLGYDSPIYNFDYQTADVKVLVHQQSNDIAIGVETGGAGDQGMMFGYAVAETPQLMPLPISLAHELVKAMDQMRQAKTLPYLRPDGKSQVVVRYEKGKPVAVEKIVLAVPYDEEGSGGKEGLRRDLYAKVVLPILEKYEQKTIKESELIVNGTGRWEIGGPDSDMGETGRKIIVDSYGGMARVGGGAFSGKCPTKVDRTGAYAARYLAKNIVAANLAQRCEVQLAYIIGYKDPVEKAIETFGTEKKPFKTIQDFADSLLDCSVWGIIKGLDLQRPIYQKTAAYGHFGREEFSWEKLAV